jgi:hypothetical protein
VAPWFKAHHSGYLKTGAHRNSAVAQLRIYVYTLPLAGNSPWKGKPPDAPVLYRDGVEIHIPATAGDDDFGELDEQYTSEA